MSVVPQRRERRHGTAQTPIPPGKEEGGFGLDVWQPREKVGHLLRFYFNLMHLSVTLIALHLLMHLFTQQMLHY